MRVVSFDPAVVKMGLCVMDWEGDEASGWRSVRVLRWEVINLLTENGCTAKNSEKVHMDRLLPMLLATLDRRPWLLENVQIVNVESQKRAKMKEVACVIKTYYAIHSPTTKVLSPNGVTKLRCCLDDPQRLFYARTMLKVPPDMTGNKNYTKRKRYAAKMAHALMKLVSIDDGLTRWFGSLTEGSGLFDAADAACFCVATIQGLGKTPKKEKKKKKVQRSETMV